jgi:hypothetical protein
VEKPSGNYFNLTGNHLNAVGKEKEYCMVIDDEQLVNKVLAKVGT